MDERLQKLIAAAGVASRRHAEELITAGRVTVNGKVVKELGTKADPEKDHIKVNGKLINPITTGKFTVTNVEYIDEKNSLVYFVARGRENTARKDYYCISLNGKILKRLSFGDYNHATINPSPNGSYFITSYSNSTTPTKLALVNNKGVVIKELGDAKAAEFNNYDLEKKSLNPENALFPLVVSS